MEYKINNIIFNNNIEYTKELYWNLYKIYSSYNNITDDFRYAAYVVGEYGPLLCKKIIDINDNYNYQEEINNMSEIDKSNIDKYYNRIIKSIPNNILNKINNIDLFKIGYIEKNIYDELNIFKSDLKNWLENPTNTNLIIDIEDKYNSIIEFHDNNYKLINNNDDIIFSGDYNNITFNNANIIIDGIEVNNIDNIEFIGYLYVGSIKYNKKYELCFETFIKGKQGINNIIVITDNVSPSN